MSTDGTETTTWDNWEVATKRLPFGKQVEAGPFRVRLVEIRTNGLGTYLEFVNDTSVIDITCATDLIGLEITANAAQTADLLAVEDSVGGNLFKVASDGALTGYC